VWYNPGNLANLTGLVGFLSAALANRNHQFAGVTNLQSFQPGLKAGRLGNLGRNGAL